MATEEIREKKQELRIEITNKIKALSADELIERKSAIQQRLFEFANFLESKITLLYVNCENEVPTRDIIKNAYDYGKIVILPAFDTEKFKMKLLKVDNPEKDLIKGPRGLLEPDPKRCKTVPIDCIDIAIVPGVALDEKGGRVGSGEGYYDRLIPALPQTARKVGLAFEEQLVPLIPMESHDKHVDIIITNKRVIYKI